MMDAHRPLMLASSPLLSVEPIKGVSVVAVPAPCACRVVPQAAIPDRTIFVVVAFAALLLQTVPVPDPFVPASVASSLTVTEVGITPVRVLEVRLVTTPRLTVWSGVTRQEQHETSSSLGSKAYTLTQMFPAAPPNPGPSKAAPLAPVLVISMYDSPRLRFAA